MWECTILLDRVLLPMSLISMKNSIDREMKGDIMQRRYQ